MEQPNNIIANLRVLIIGLASVVLVVGMSLLLVIVNQAGKVVESGTVNALTQSKDPCITCHFDTSIGIVEQFGRSSMAAAKVTCRDCHTVSQDYPGAQAHEDAYILASPTTGMCGKCHETEVAEFNQSRHALPAYVAVFGSQHLDVDLLAMYQNIPEGSYAPDKSRNAIAALEGENLTPFTCEGCHDVGRPAADGSVGQCQKCHLRHTFSLEQARKPETCNACHIGPDHPQWEIYQESPHGIAYMTDGDRWDWETAPGTLDTVKFPAPTCAVCHMSAFGTSSTTHDVGDRLSWYLFAPISSRRPVWDENLLRMKGVCLECHNSEFIEDFYTAADKATARVNEMVTESDEIIAALKEQQLLTDAAFDEPIDYIYFELWHHWGRTTKFGVWMQGADYAQWHGAYEILSDLAELKAMAEEKTEQAEQ